MTAPSARLTPASSVWLRVPEVTALFWTIKILTTGMGETLSDYLGTHLAPEIAGVIILAAFIAAFVVLFRSTSFYAWRYWAAVSMVSVLGTVVADVIHAVGIPYVVSSAVFGVAVAVILWTWRRATGSLDVHDITTRRAELYYWATVCATFALGTALGDWTAASLHLGYLLSAVVFGVAICLPLVGWRLGMNAVTAFWIAYVLTRPLGASTADWLADARHGGLGWGTGPVTAGWVIAIVVLVAVVARRDRRPAPLPQR
ncbi:membrane protein [Williamsia deligens]|nr:putative membrane-anchored protein [Williamsia deligens]